MQEEKQELGFTNPSSLLQIAVQQNFDIDKLKQLMDLQERWEQKQSKKSFLAALSKFQTLVPVLKKSKIARVPTKTGGSFQYRYADLGSITQAIKNPLQDCGLSYRWEFSETAGRMKVTCIVSHIDGHTETASMEATADNSGAKNDIQQKGSTHTYLQRYTLIGALGLSTADEDNDGGKTVQGEKSKDDDKEATTALWKQALAEVKTKIHLTNLYVQNRKVVDSDKELQALFKQKELELKSAETNSKSPKVNMP